MTKRPLTREDLMHELQGITGSIEDVRSIVQGQVSAVERVVAMIGGDPFVTDHGDPNHPANALIGRIDRLEETGKRAETITKTLMESIDKRFEEAQSDGFGWSKISAALRKHSGKLSIGAILLVILFKDKVVAVLKALFGALGA